MKVIVKNESDERDIKKVLKRVDSYCGMKQTSITLNVNLNLPVTAQIVLDKMAGEGCIVYEDDNSVVINCFG